MNQTKGRCQDTSFCTIAYLLHRSVHVTMAWCYTMHLGSKALSLRTIARGKQYSDVHKQTTNKQLLNFTREIERERETEIIKPKKKIRKSGDRAQSWIIKSPESKSRKQMIHKTRLSRCVTQVTKAISLQGGTITSWHAPKKNHPKRNGPNVGSLQYGVQTADPPTPGCKILPQVTLIP